MGGIVGLLKAGRGWEKVGKVDVLSYISRGKYRKLLIFSSGLFRKTYSMYRRGEQVHELWTSSEIVNKFRFSGHFFFLH